MARRLRVQHWIACLGARIEPPVGPRNFYNLNRVGYTHTVPPDAEFPSVLPRLDMFARFVNGRGSAEFETRVVWLDAPEGRRLVDFFGPLRVVFRPSEPVRDAVFRFLNVPIEGKGRYRIELRSVKPRRRQPLGIEFITVVQ